MHKKSNDIVIKFIANVRERDIIYRTKEYYLWQELLI